LYGYSPKGQRCYGKFDFNAKGRINVIGGLLGNKVVAPLMCKFNIDANVFLKWIKEVLHKAIPKNSVLVMDNASFHKREDILDTINELGHEALFLPPYSPELNPIEKKWAHLKHIRRKYRLDVNTLLTCFI
jgi:transposase